MNLTNAIFAICVFLTPTFLYLAFRKDREGNRGGFSFLFAFLLFLFLTLGAGRMVLVERANFRALEGLITPLPSISGFTAVPSQKELELMAASMRAWSEIQSKVGLRGRFYTTEDYRRLEQQIKQNPIKDSYWMIDTPMTVEEISQFYHREENRKGWEITEDFGNFLTLKRDGFTLFIHASKTWYPDKRQVSFHLRGKQ